jgi:hypothetical protein
MSASDASMWTSRHPTSSAPNGLTLLMSSSAWPVRLAPSTGKGHDPSVITAGRAAPRLGAVALLVMALPGCSRGEHGPEPASHNSEVLGNGIAAGHPWRLTVFSNPEGQLCMAVNDQLEPARKHDSLMEAGCGFGPPDHRLASPTDAADVGTEQLVWGPSPVGAVRVRIDSFTLKAQLATNSSAANIPGCRAETPAHLWVTITHRLPAWAKPGGWFITHAARNGCGYLDAVFYDRNDHVVEETRW